MLLAATLVGTGCGSDTSTPKSPSSAPTRSASTPNPSPTLADGTEYADPAGLYRLTVGRSWTAGTTEQPKLWFLDDTQREFNDNVIVTSEVARADVTIEKYLEISIQNAPKILDDFSLDSQEIITLPSGAKAARMAYLGKIGNNPVLQVLGISTLRGRRAVTVTLTAPPERFDSRVRAAEPFMRTIEVLKG